MHLPVSGNVLINSASMQTHGSESSLATERMPSSWVFHASKLRLPMWNRESKSLSFTWGCRSWKGDVSNIGYVREIVQNKSLEEGLFFVNRILNLTPSCVIEHLFLPWNNVESWLKCRDSVVIQWILLSKNHLRFLKWNVTIIQCNVF